MTTPESRQQPSHEQTSQRNASSTRNTASKGSVASEPSDAKRPAGNAQLDPSEQSQRRDMRGDPRNGPEGSYRGSAAAGGDEGRAPLLPSDAGEPEGFATTQQAELPDEHAHRSSSGGSDEFEDGDDEVPLNFARESAETLDALVDPAQPAQERALSGEPDELGERASTAEPAELEEAAAQRHRASRTSS